MVKRVTVATGPKHQKETHRKLLQSKAIAIENDLRAALRNFGLKVGMVGTVKFEARIKQLVESVGFLHTILWNSQKGANGHRPVCAEN